MAENKWSLACCIRLGLSLLVFSGHFAFGNKYNSKLHTNLDIDSLAIISPPPCASDATIDILYAIHTAPKNFDLRHTLRNTWASNMPNSKTRRVFFIGRADPGIEKLVINESKTFNDIFLYNAIDSYRNMTLKVSVRYACHYATVFYTQFLVPYTTFCCM